MLALCLFTFAHAALAQSQPPTTSPQPAATPTFEVATTKPSNSDGSSQTRFIGDNRFQATNITLQNMLEWEAFGIPGSRIVGGPKWLDSQHFDIEAKMDANSAAQVKALNGDQRILVRQAMFQQFLADRFQLKTHWEERELPVLALVPAKGGPKLQPAQHPERGTSGSSGNTQLQGNNVTITQLVEMLTQDEAHMLGKVVIDKTSIAGTYDIFLKWMPDTNSESGPAATAAGPSFFTALQEQLGLKLEPTKGPVRILVIDHAEMPSEN